MSIRGAPIARGFVASLSAIIMAAAVARAAPPRLDEKNYGPGFSQWFLSLHAPDTGIPCCSAADCRAVEYRMSDNGFEIHPLQAYDDRISAEDERVWTKVPEEKALRRTPNPTGHAIACYSVVRRLSGPATLSLYCFIPEAGS